MALPFTPEQIVQLAAALRQADPGLVAQQVPAPAVVAQAAPVAAPVPPLAAQLVAPGKPAAAERAAEPAEVNPNAGRFAIVGNATRAAEPAKPDPLVSILRSGRALAATKGNREAALDLIRKTYGDTYTADELERTMQAQDPASGGFLIPEAWSDVMIEMLQPSSILGNPAVNYTTIPNETGTLHFSKETAEPTAYWGPPEAPADAGVKASKSQWGGLTVTEKDLWAFLIFSNKLLRSAKIGVDQWGVKQLRRVFSKALDRASHFGRNSKYEPCGLYTNPIYQACNVFSQAGVPDANLPIKMLMKHMENDGPLEDLVWTMGPTLYGLLMMLRTEDGYSIYKDLDKKMLLGYPVVVSTQIPVQNASHSPTYLTLGSWSSYLVSPVRGLELAYSSEANVPDENGNMRSLFGNAESAIRMNWSGDIGPMQPKAFTLCKDVWTVGS